MHKDGGEKRQISELTTKLSLIATTQTKQNIKITGSIKGLPSAPSSPLSSPSTAKKTPYPLRATRSLLKFGLLKKRNSSYGNFNTPATEELNIVKNNGKIYNNETITSPPLIKENIIKRRTRTIKSRKKRNEKRANSISNATNDFRPLLASSMAAAAGKITLKNF